MESSCPRWRGQGLCPRPGPGPHQATPHIMAVLPPGWHDTGRAGGLVLNIGTITHKHSHRTVMPTHRPSERTTVPSTLQFTPLRVAHPQGHVRVAMGLPPQCRVRSLHSRPRVRRTGLRGQCLRLPERAVGRPGEGAGRAGAGRTDRCSPSERSPASGLRWQVTPSGGAPSAHPASPGQRGASRRVPTGEGARGHGEPREAGHRRLWSGARESKAALGGWGQRRPTGFNTKSTRPQKCPWDQGSRSGDEQESSKVTRC